MKIILIGFFLSFISLAAQCQNDRYGELKNAYDLFRKEEKHDSALVIAKQMNAWALKNDTDTSLRYAVSLRYVGNCYYLLEDNNMALSFWKSSVKILEKKNRILTNDNFLALKYIGHLYLTSGNFKKADEILKRAKIIAITIYQKDNKKYIDFLEETANKYENSMQYSLAIEYYTIILNHLKDIDESETKYFSDIHSKLGVTYFNSGDYSKAKNILQESCEIASRIYGLQNIKYANNLVNLGLSLVELGDFQQAVQCYDKSIKIYFSLDQYNEMNFARILGNYANLLSDLDRFEEAEKKYIEALKIYEKDSAQMKLSYAQCLLNFAILKAEKDCFYEAKNMMSQSISIILFIKGEKSPDYINSLLNLAALKSDMGETDSALLDFNLAANLSAENLGFDNKIYLHCLFGIGNIYHDLGQFQKAEEFLLKAAEGYKRVYGERSLDYTGCLNTLGGLYMDLGFIDKSERILEKAYEINTSLVEPYHSSQVVIKSNLSNLTIYKGDFLKAQKQLEEQAETIKNIYGQKHSYLAQCYNKLGSIYSELTLDSLSIFYFKEALRIYSLEDSLNEKGIAMVLFNLGNVYSDNNSFSNAYNCYLKSLEIHEVIYGPLSSIFGSGIYNIGVLYWNNRLYKDAILKFNQVNKINIYNLNSNFAWLTNSEKEFYWQQKKEFYFNMNSFSVSAIDSIPTTAELSFNTNLISKSLLLETSREFDKAISHSSDEEMKSQFTEMKQLRKLYINLQTEESPNKEEMDRFKSQADSLDKILVNKLGEYAASKRKFEITWKDIQSNITSTEAAIEFARYYDDKDSAYKYLALVVRPGYDYPKLVKLGKEEDIRTANQPKGQDFATLYDLVWRGVDSLLTGVNTVYYSPAGELNNLAFSALCFEAGDSLVSSMTAQNRGVVIKMEGDSSRSCKAVLMDKYTLHQITTTRYLADGTLKKERLLNSSITLLGGINYNDLPATVKDAKYEESEQDFALNINLTNRNNEKQSNRSSSSIGKPMNYLEGTRDEVKHIATQLNGTWSVQTLSDGNASEHSLKSQMEKTSPGVLHIASHGFAFPDEIKKESKLMEMNQTSTYKVSEDPMVRCGLMLSGSNISWTGNPKKMIEQTGDDGILTAAEVANLDLSNTKLVVLSACETGLGKIEGSEGTFGLKRGFKLAGVEQMIVSLWSVPDKETMELMTLFYTDLAKTLNPVTSFAKAQKEMRNKYPTEPEKWAGFVLVR